MSADSGRWVDLPWVNRYSGREYRITTEPSGGKVTPGVVCVKTYRDVLEEYLAHPEAKSAGPDGERCRTGSKGLLHRRPVRMQTIWHIGKESNRLEDVQMGLVQDLAEVQSEYDDFYRRVFVPLVMPVLRETGVRDTARRTGHSVGAVSAALAGRSRPRPDAVARYEAAAARFAEEQMGEGLVAENGTPAMLRAYLNSLTPPSGGPA